MISDNDIKEALERCKNVVMHDCKNCFYHKEYNAKCVVMLVHDALDLINRKDAEIEKLNVELVGMRGACESYKMHYDNAQAEIERLQKDNEYILMQHKFDRRPNGDCWNDVIEKAKTEAIKEFAERLKKEVAHIPAWGSVAEKKIDNLVKEMTEESENG